jgi:cysteine desulfurase
VSLLAAVPDVAASAGAACHSGEVNVSGTLRAMGVSEEVALGTIRFSTGSRLTEEDVDRAVAAFVAAAAR